MAITGNIPLTVEFSDTSTGDNLTYLWDFGDGRTSTEQNPSHEYTVAGDYTVSLTTTNNYGSDIRTDTISAASTANGGNGGDFDGGQGGGFNDDDFDGGKGGNGKGENGKGGNGKGGNGKGGNK